MREGFNPLALDNQSKKGVERIIEFCMPDLVVHAMWPKNMDNGDISVANLRRDFEKLNAERQIYEDYDQFIESLKMFLLIDIKEDGIFTNFFYKAEVIARKLQQCLDSKELPKSLSV